MKTITYKCNLCNRTEADIIEIFGVGWKDSIGSKLPCVQLQKIDKQLADIHLCEFCIKEISMIHLNNINRFPGFAV